MGRKGSHHRLGMLVRRWGGTFQEAFGWRQTWVSFLGAHCWDCGHVTCKRGHLLQGVNWSNLVTQRDTCTPHVVIQQGTHFSAMGFSRTEEERLLRGAHAICPECDGGHCKGWCIGASTRLCLWQQGLILWELTCMCHCLVTVPLSSDFSGSMRLLKCLTSLCSSPDYAAVQTDEDSTSHYDLTSLPKRVRNLVISSLKDQVDQPHLLSAVARVGVIRYFAFQILAKFPTQFSGCCPKSTSVKF